MSPIFQVVQSALLCLAVLSYLGFGLIGLSRRPLGSRELLLAPVVGMGYLGLWTWWSYRLGFSLDTANAVIMLLPATLFNGFVFGRAAQSRWRPAIPKLKFYAWLGLAWTAVFAATALPLFRHEGSLLVSLGNNDLAHHTAIARFLQESNWTTTTGYVSQYPHAFVWFADNTYFGYFALIAVCASLSASLPHEVVSGVLYAISATTIIPVWLILRDAFRVPALLALLWSVLATGSALVLYLSYNGFGAQLLGTMCGLYILHLLRRPRVAGWTTTLLTVQVPLFFALAALLASYQHMLPFVLILSIAEAGAVAVLTRKCRGLAWIISLLALPTIMTLVVAFARWRALATWLLDAAQSDSGWPVAFIWPDFWLGLTGPTYHPMHVGATPWPIRAVALAMLAALVVIGIIFGLRRRQGKPLAYIFGLSVIVAGALFLAKHNGPAGYGGYKSFKLLSFFAPCFTIAVACLWHEMWRRGSLWRVAAAVYLAIFLGYFTVSVRSIQAALAGGKSLQTDAAAIMHLSTGPQPESVNIVSEDYWASMWTTYFLLQSRQFIGFRSYYPPMALEGEITLAQESNRFFSNIMREETPAPWRFWRLAKGGCTITSFGSGWHSPEAAHAWMGATGTSATLNVQVARGVSELQVTLDLIPFLTDNSYTLRWNGEPVLLDHTVPNIIVRIADPRPGENVLELVSQRPPQPPGGGDPRPICFGLRHCSISVLR